MERESFYYVTGFLNAVVDGKNRAACEVFPILHVFRFSSQKNFIAAANIGNKHLAHRIRLHIESDSVQP